eukprot:TRINITY_DN15734_c0_g1_i1.p1 TRINITY_DN15734_c0_g1~~TRINITY_DN15734_c0_g1_i1.p1  ORF type:complete len:120 (-),score=43.21 TRINITY_DN15734_c0_g1_i1:93-452(-)
MSDAESSSKSSSPVKDTKKADKEKKAKKPKIVPFDVNELANMNRKKLQSLAKRCTIKANKSSEEIRAALQEYYDENKDDILELRKKAKAESKKRADERKKEKEEKEKDKKKSSKKSSKK